MEWGAGFDTQERTDDEAADSSSSEEEEEEETAAAFFLRRCGAFFFFEPALALPPLLLMMYSGRAGRLAMSCSVGKLNLRRQECCMGVPLLFRLATGLSKALLNGDEETRERE